MGFSGLAVYVRFRLRVASCCTPARGRGNLTTCPSTVTPTVQSAAGSVGFLLSTVILYSQVRSMKLSVLSRSHANTSPKA